MTVYFYQMENDGKNEPDTLYNVGYVHVKTKTDGSHTIIMTSDAIPTEDSILLDQATAQTTLNAWIDEENIAPLPQDIDGNDIVQSYIDLNNLIINQAILLEQAELYKVQRGYFDKDEAQEFASVDAMRTNYPLTTKNMTPSELELLWQKMVRIVGING